MYNNCRQYMIQKHVQRFALFVICCYLQGGPKIGTPFLYALTFQILTDFQNYFTVRIRRKLVIILSLKIPSHIKCVATLPCEMSSALKAISDNRTTSVTVTTHFKKLTTGSNVFIVSVIV